MFIIWGIKFFLLNYDTKSWKIIENEYPFFNWFSTKKPYFKLAFDFLNSFYTIILVSFLVHFYFNNKKIEQIESKLTKLEKENIGIEDIKLIKPIYKEINDLKAERSDLIMKNSGKENIEIVGIVIFAVLTMINFALN